MVVILDFGLGQGRLIVRAPQHRLQALVHAAPLHELAELTQNRRFIVQAPA